jgi:hypothetical protein
MNHSTSLQRIELPLKFEENVEGQLNWAWVLEGGVGNWWRNVIGCRWVYRKTKLVEKALWLTELVEKCNVMFKP